MGALLVGVLGAGVAAHRFWMRQLSHLTGDAEWVWTTDVLSRLHPTTGLFVAGLRLDAPPGAALLKVCGDREYVVWINGTAAACGWSRPGFRLDMYDVAHLLRQGSNVLAFEVRSAAETGGDRVAAAIIRLPADRSSGLDRAPGAPPPSRSPCSKRTTSPRGAAPRAFSPVSAFASTRGASSS